MPFAVDDCLELLMDRREEEFNYERQIRLFQFQTWIFYSSPKLGGPQNAGRLAAAALLGQIEEEYEWGGDRDGSNHMPISKLHAVSESEDYQQIYDEFIASKGGWSTLLFNTLGAPEFDQKIKQRSEKWIGIKGKQRVPEFIAALIHYRLRCSMSPQALRKRSKVSHAIFFEWWPRRNAFTARTAWHWWKQFHRTAGFIYLTYNKGFPMVPPCAKELNNFISKLTNPAMTDRKLRNFFSQYQFIVDTLRDKQLQLLPRSIPPTPFKITPFSRDELAIIEAYDKHAIAMSDSKKDTADIDLEEGGEF